MVAAAATVPRTSFHENVNNDDDDDDDIAAAAAAVARAAAAPQIRRSFLWVPEWREKRTITSDYRSRESEKKKKRHVLFEVDEGSE